MILITNFAPVKRTVVILCRFAVIVTIFTIIIFMTYFSSIGIALIKGMGGIAITLWSNPWVITEYSNMGSQTVNKTKGNVAMIMIGYPIKVES